KANLAPTLKLVGEILRTPTFPGAEFDLLKKEKLEQLATQKTDPIYLAARLLQRKLQDYPKGNIRYVPTVEEAIELVNGTTLGQGKEVYGTLLGAQAGELSAVGDFDPAVVTAELGPALAGWKSAVPYKRIDRPAKPVEKGETIKINTPDKENAVYFAGLAYPLT